MTPRDPKLDRPAPDVQLSLFGPAPDDVPRATLKLTGAASGLTIDVRFGGTYGIVRWSLIAHRHTGLYTDQGLSAIVTEDPVTVSRLLGREGLEPS